MTQLKTFIDGKNLWRSFGDQAPYDINNLSQKDVNELADSLDGEMSPENLHCDGEISAAQARKKAKHFTAAYKELTALAASKGYVLPEAYCF